VPHGCSSICLCLLVHFTSPCMHKEAPSAADEFIALRGRMTLQNPTFGARHPLCYAHSATTTLLRPPTRPRKWSINQQAVVGTTKLSFLACQTPSKQHKAACQCTPPFVTRTSQLVVLLTINSTSTQGLPPAT
jgi:hypothetical protein